jgi:hypothetical protein
MDRRDKRRNTPDAGMPLEYTPGYSIYVYGQGEVRIDVPSGWHLTQTENTTELRDQPEPDTCGMIQITVFPPIPAMGFPGIPLRKLFRDMQTKSGVEVLSRGPIHEERSRDLHMLWQERRYVDEESGRIARGTTYLARGGSRHMVVTCTCWDEGTEQFHPIFEVVRRSIRITDLGDALTGHRQRARDN